jgi:hypothetical protein
MEPRTPIFRKFEQEVSFMTAVGDVPRNAMSFSFCHLVRQMKDVAFAP